MATDITFEDLVFREVTRETWPDFESLFESRGGPKHCWCMAWRPGRFQDGQSRKAAMQQLVHDGVPIGILAYLEGKPIAWCSVAPRPTHRRLVSASEHNDNVWSITCFFVSSRLRGTSVARHLLAAAVQHARAQGAQLVESYPVDPDSPSYRFMGFVSMFANAGFAEVGREGTRRHVMQLVVE